MTMTFDLRHGTVTRIQRCRKRGFKMPAGTAYVGRGRHCRWGNPYRVIGGDYQTAALAYRIYLKRNPALATEIRDQLAGQAYVACWCSLDKPCHGDAIAELLSGTWNHVVRHLSVADLQNGHPCGAVYLGAGTCEQTAVRSVSWRYSDTNRPGVGTDVRLVCREHAQAFAQAFIEMERAA